MSMNFGVNTNTSEDESVEITRRRQTFHSGVNDKQSAAISVRKSADKTRHSSATYGHVVTWSRRQPSCHRARVYSSERSFSVHEECTFDGQCAVSLVTLLALPSSVMHSGPSSVFVQQQCRRIVANLNSDDRSERHPIRFSSTINKKMSIKS